MVKTTLKWIFSFLVNLNKNLFIEDIDAYLFLDIGAPFIFNVTANGKVMEPKKGEIVLIEGDKVNITCAAIKFVYKNVLLNIDDLEGKTFTL